MRRNFAISVNNYRVWQVVSESPVSCYALTLFAKVLTSFQNMESLIMVVRSASTLWELFTRATKLAKRYARNRSSTQGRIFELCTSSEPSPEHTLRLSSALHNST